MGTPKKIVMIAGPNGAGKTSGSCTITRGRSRFRSPQGTIHEQPGAAVTRSRHSGGGRRAAPSRPTGPGSRPQDGHARVCVEGRAHCRLDARMEEASPRPVALRKARGALITPAGALGAPAKPLSKNNLTGEFPETAYGMHLTGWRREFHTQADPPRSLPTESVTRHSERKPFRDRSARNRNEPAFDPGGGRFRMTAPRPDQDVRIKEHGSGLPGVSPFPR